MEKTIKQLEKQLEEIEDYERMGYIFNGHHYPWVDNCKVSEIFFHFKKKEEIRKMIAELRKEEESKEKPSLEKEVFDETELKPC